MKSTGDPTRMRDLPGGLPRALAKALANEPRDEPTADEVRHMHAAVRFAVGLPPTGYLIAAHPLPVSAAHAGGVAAKVSWMAAPWVSLVAAPMGVGALVASVAIGAAIATTTPHVPPPIPLPSASASNAGRSGAPSAPLMDREALGNVTPRASEISGAAKDRFEPSLRPNVSPGARSDEPLVATPSAQGIGNAEPGDVAVKATELSILSVAQSQLEKNPEGALEATREHQRRFATGHLIQEREVLAIDALTRLGRVGEAQQRAQLFHARFPGSAYGRRVDVIVHPLPH